jgi:hypothetical protein
MSSLLLISYLGSFGGIGVLSFPMDLVVIFPLSMIVLQLSQIILKVDNHIEINGGAEIYSS